MSENATLLPRIAVLISGSGTNLQAIIDKVANGALQATIVAVVSDQPGAFGLTRAADAGLDTVVIDYAEYDTREQAERELGDTLTNLAPDIVVLAGFMRILPDAIVEQFSGRMLNIHPSLLPLYTGLDTYARALAAGDAWHGSTVHFVTAELDAGPAIIQYRVRIRPEDTETSLARRVQQGEYIVYPRAIGWLAAGRIRMSGQHTELDGETLAGPVVVDE